MRRFVAAGLSLAAVLLCGGMASARPLVALKLSAATVERASDGTQRAVPLEGKPVHAGDVLRWDVLATNSGDRPANHLIPSARIPAGTAYVPASASHTGATRVEFSLDGGKTWSASPTIVVKKADGTSETRKAHPSTYTAIRWVTSGALAANTSAHYTYEVRVR